MIDYIVKSKFKIKTIVSFLLLVFSYCSFSQAPLVEESWVRTFSASDTTQNRPVAIDIMGNVYVTGNVLIEDNFGITTGASATTIKYDKDGNLIWQQSFGNNPSSFFFVVSVAVNQDCDVFITGSLNGNVTTVKYDSLGVEEWTATSGSGSPNALATDSQGNVYITSSSFGATGGDIVTTKYNENGVQQWTNSIGGNAATSFDFGTAMASDAQGNTYVLGSVQNTTTNYDFAVVKYNSSGSQQWIRTVDGGHMESDFANKIAIDDLGNVAIAGTSTLPGGNQDIATVKINASGGLEWIRTYDGPAGAFDHGNDVTIDNQGNITTIGTISTTFDPSTFITDNDIITIRYNSSGVQNWSRVLAGSPGEYDAGSGIVSDQDGNSYIVASLSAGSFSRNFVTIKYDPLGSELWRQTHPGIEATTIAQGSDNDLYVIGIGNNGIVDEFVIIKYQQPQAPQAIGRERYWIAQSPGDWTDANNWSYSPSGPGGADPPVDSTIVIFDGNGIGNCTVNTQIKMDSLVVHSSYNGIITQGANKIEVKDFILSGGTFQGGTEEVRITHDYVQNGGTYISPDHNTLVFNDFVKTSGNYEGTVGTLFIFGFDGSSSLIADSLSVYKLWLSNQSNVNHHIPSTTSVWVTNQLIIGNTNSFKHFYTYLGGGTINILGDVRLIDEGGSRGDLHFNMIGTADQHIISEASSTSTGAWLTNITINKPAGKVILDGYVTVDGNWNLISGSVEVADNETILIFRSFGIVSIGGLPFTVPNLVFANHSGSNVQADISFNTEITVLDSMAIVPNRLMLFSNGTIHCKGNLFQSGTCSTGGGTTNIIFDGIDDQTISSSVTDIFNGCLLPKLTIDKPSGTLHFKGQISLGDEWHYNKGNLNFAPNSSLAFIYRSFHPKAVNITGADFNVPKLVISTTGFTGYDLATNLTITTDSLEISRNFVRISGGNIQVNQYASITGTTPITTNLLISGAVDQYLETDNQGIIQSVIVNKPAGNLILNAPWSISSVETVQLIKGNIVSSSANPLIIENDATISGTAQGHIEGPITKIGDDPFTFPTGKNGNYQPITITAPNVITDQYTAEYFNTEQTLGSVLGVSLKGISTCEYWNLSRDLGTSNVNTTIGWNTNSCDISSLPQDMELVNWDGTQWNTISNTNASGNQLSGTINTTQGLTSYGNFTLGYSRIYINGCEGPYTTTNAISDGSGNTKWTNLNNGELADNSYIQVTGLQKNKWSDYLELTNFGFNLPTGATIEGIEVSIEGQSTGEIKSEDVTLIKGGNYLNPARDIGDWQQGTDEIRIYGAGDDLWTGQAWTITEINDPGFGVALRVQSKQNGTDVLVDQVTVKVCYTDPNNLPPTTNIYYSINNGAWDDPNTWSTVSHTSNVNTGTYPQDGDEVRLLNNTINVANTVTIKSITLDNPSNFHSYINVFVLGHLTVEEDVTLITGTGDKEVGIRLSDQGQLDIQGNLLAQNNGGKKAPEITLSNESKLTVAGDMELNYQAGSKGPLFLLQDEASTDVGGTFGLQYASGAKQVTAQLMGNSILSIGGNIQYKTPEGGKAQLLLEENSTLNLGGNFLKTNEHGVFNAIGTSTLVFNGNIEQQLPTNTLPNTTDQFTYQNIVLNKTTGQVLADGNIDMNGVLNLGINTLDLQGATLTLNNTSPNSLSHLLGKVKNGEVAHFTATEEPYTYPLQNTDGNSLTTKLTSGSIEQRKYTMGFTPSSEPVFETDITLHGTTTETVLLEMGFEREGEQEEEDADIEIDINNLGEIATVRFRNIRSENFEVLPTSFYTLNTEQTRLTFISGEALIMGLRESSICEDDLGRNWVMSKSYDFDRNLIGSSISYSDNLGKPVQTQFKSFTEDLVFANQNVYDKIGRPSINTLVAPTDQEEICYKDKFFTNTSLENYSSIDFDVPNYTSNTSTLTLGEVDNPKPAGGEGHLGNLRHYYSNSNSDEPYVPNSAFPYARVQYNDITLEGLSRASSAGEHLKMGTGKEVSNCSMAAAGELNYVFDYVRWGHTLFSADQTDENQIFAIVNNTIGYKVTKVITRDENGVERVSFFDFCGKLLATCIASVTFRKLNVVKSADLGTDFIDVHITEQKPFNAQLIHNYDVVDLYTGNTILENQSSTTINLPPGCYRLYGVSSLTYELNYHDWTLYKYDLAGRLVEVIPPEGIDRSYVPDLRFTNFEHPRKFYTDTYDWSLSPATHSTEYSYNIPLASSPNSTQITQLWVNLREEVTGGGSGNFTARLAADDSTLCQSCNLLLTPAEVAQSLGYVLEGSSIQAQEDIQYEQIFIGTPPTPTQVDVPCAECNGFNYDQCGTTDAIEHLTQLCREAVIDGAEWGQFFQYDLSSVGQGDVDGVPGNEPNFMCYNCIGARPGPGYQYKYDVYFDIEVNDAGGTTKTIASNRKLVAKRAMDGTWTFVVPEHPLLGSYGNQAVINFAQSEISNTVTLKVNQVDEFHAYVSFPPLGDPFGIIEQTFDYLYLDEIEIVVNDLIYDFSDNIPEHKMASTYQYNSLNWLLSQETPDEGKTEYVYRKDGQIRFSQSSKQRAVSNENVFSYTNYDQVGRPIESGEYRGTTYQFENHDEIKTGISGISILTDVNTLDLPDNECFEKQYLQYDRADPDFGAETGLNIADYCQRFLLTKVSKSSNDNSTTWYSFDELGRTVWVVQKINNFGVKTIHYEYDIASNLAKVIYQKDDATERFEHQYTYDADNRLIKVETREQITDPWLLHANYDYYLHGNLKRIELGDELQGIDYVYTINGWLKSINNPSLELKSPELTPLDPGLDGMPGENANVAPDLFGMSLDYFNRDYSRSNTYIQYGDNQTTNYFNGNIKSIRWRIKDQVVSGPAAAASTNNQWMYNYTYDENNWLTNATFGSFNVDHSINNFTASNTGNTATFTSGLDYKVDLSYDNNGNILSLIRNAYQDPNFGAGGLQRNMDGMTYNYSTTASRRTDNRLNFIHDSEDNAIVNAFNDLKSQSAGNYQYNTLGQMVADAVDGSHYKYNLIGQIIGIYSDATFNNPKVEFDYNSQGQRIKKRSYNAVTGAIETTTYYIRDAAGQVICTYDQQGTATPTVSEYNLYGASRLGIYYPQSPVYVYEITDHVGNVRAVVNRNGKTDGSTVLDDKFDTFNTDNWQPHNSITNLSNDNGELKIFSPGSNSETTPSGAQKTFNTVVGTTYTGSMFVKTHLAWTDYLEIEVKEQGTGNVLHFAGHNVNTSNGTVSVDGYVGRTIYFEFTASSPNTVISITNLVFNSHLGLIHEVFDVKVDNISITSQPELQTLAHSDFYPFGMQMPGRNKVSSVNYKYGFGTFAEKDDETESYSYKFRDWDGRLARWTSTDIAGQYNTPYSGIGNDPVNGFEFDGAYRFPVGASNETKAAIRSIVNASRLLIESDPELESAFRDFTNTYEGKNQDLFEDFFTEGKGPILRIGRRTRGLTSRNGTRIYLGLKNETIGEFAATLLHEYVHYAQTKNPNRSYLNRKYGRENLQNALIDARNQLSPNQINKFNKTYGFWLTSDDKSRITEWGYAFEKIAFGKPLVNAPNFNRINLHLSMASYNLGLYLGSTIRFGRLFRYRNIPTF